MNSKFNLTIFRTLLILIAVSGLAACNSGGSTTSGSSIQMSSFNESYILSNGAGTPATTTVSLNNFAGVGAVLVNYTPSNSSVTITPNACLLGAGVSCNIIVKGQSVSSAVTITASASGYASVTSTPLHVYTQITPTLTNPTVGSTATYSVNGTQVSFSGAIESSSLSNTSFIVESTSSGSTGLAGTFTLNRGESVVTFIPATPLNFNNTYYVTTTSAIADSHGQPVVALATSSFLTQESLVIYLAVNNGNGWDGDLLVAGLALNPTPSINTGVAGADVLCQADPGCPAGSTCQAMIVDDNGTREAAPTATNWVLESSTPYMNAIGSLIGTTNGSAIFVFDLESAINSDPNTLSAWTGMSNANWDTFTANTCNSWETFLPDVGLGGTGNPNYTTYVAIASSNAESCAVSRGLYCVQQP